MLTHVQVINDNDPELAIEKEHVEKIVHCLHEKIHHN